MSDKYSSTQQIILASQSPRRAAILQALGVSYAIVVSDAEEVFHFPPVTLQNRIPVLAIAADDHPVVRAWRKGNHVAQQYPEAVVLAADTIVVCDTQVLNKPVDVADALRMLSLLAGRSHDVYTGMVLFAPAHEPIFWVEASRVAMRELNPDEMQRYVDTGEPMDKAGSYGIQGIAGSLVTAVIGSFTNVVGLPLEATISLLRTVGIQVPISAADAYSSWRVAHPLLRSDLGNQP